VSTTQNAIATIPTEHPMATAITVATLSPSSSLSSVLALPWLPVVSPSSPSPSLLSDTLTDDVAQFASSGEGINSEQDLVAVLVKFVP